MIRHSRSSHQGAGKVRMNQRRHSHQMTSPAFDHAIFPVGLGFVAGFVDVFGFMAWYGLLAAHVTGNLVFIAVDLAEGHYDLVMKAAALPIFAASVAVSAWLIGKIDEHDHHPFQPAMLLQAALLGLCLVAGLVMPPPKGPDDTTAVVIGSIALFAMALQNTMMRMVLNNLPPTTVMTGNITHVVGEAVHWLVGFHAGLESAEASSLARRARQIGFTLLAFTVGAIAGGLAEIDVGYVGLLLPIATLLALLPFGRTALRVSAKQNA